MSGSINSVSPSVTSLFGGSMPAKARAVALRQAANISIGFTLYDSIGRPVDLTAYDDVHIRMQLREIINGEPCALAVDALVITPEEGTVTGIVPQSVAQSPGIYYVEAGVFQESSALVTTNQVAGTGFNQVYISNAVTNFTATACESYTITVLTGGVGGVATLGITSSSGTDNVASVVTAVFGSPTTIGTLGASATFNLDGDRATDDGLEEDEFVVGQQWTFFVQPSLMFSNVLYAYIEPSTFNNPTPNVMFPLPMINDVRLRLWDVDPAANRLINEYEFDLADLCAALERVVRYWNTAQPPIDLAYNTTNFPYYMPNGYIGYLLEMAAHRFRRNHLPYQGGGLSIDDQNKYDQYFKTSTLLLKEYYDFIRTKKIQLNAEMAFGSITSGYSTYGRLW